MNGLTEELPNRHGLSFLILLYHFVEYVGHGIFHWVALSFVSKNVFFGWGRDPVK